MPSPDIADQPRPPLRVVVCGGGGDGAGALLARLMSEGLAAVPARDIDDGTGRSISAPARRISVVDASADAHVTAAMVDAGASADLAILRVDARKGVVEATRRDAHLLSLLGVRHVVLAVDGIELVDDAEAPFGAIVDDFRAFAIDLGLADIVAVPVSSTRGDNIATRSGRMAWYAGPALIECLESAHVDAEADVAAAAPLASADQFEAAIVWMDAAPLLRGRSYRMRIGAHNATATVAPIKYRIDVNTLGHVAAGKLGRDDIGVCDIELDRAVAFAPYAQNRQLGRFDLIDRVTGHTAGVGLIRFALRRASNLHWQAFDVDRRVRALQKAQRPCVLWFTGLSGAGKSTIANLVDRKLNAEGRHTYVLDGDNVRKGLNKDLGFTAADRVENIRRIAEVAALMADAGLIVLAAFISPFRDERAMARARLAEGEFVEVFVDTPLALAEARDVQGLYRKARRGELANFTGIDSPYEPPLAPEIRIDSAVESPEAAAARIVDELRRRGFLAT
jgi:bifunctional enzyme CysN/CysC